MGGDTRQVFGLPILTVVSVIAFAVYGFFTYALATEDVLFANSSVGIKAFIVILVISALAYPVSYAVNRRRGVDLSLANTTLPPE